MNRRDFLKALGWASAATIIPFAGLTKAPTPTRDQIPTTRYRNDPAYVELIQRPPTTPPQPLYSISRHDNIWDAADVTFHSVTGGTVTGISITDAEGYNLGGILFPPITPSGGDITIEWDPEGMLQIV